MEAEYAVMAQPYLLYDGMNSADMRDAVENLVSAPTAIESEADGVLTIKITYDYAGNPGDVYYSISQGFRFCPPLGQSVSAADWAAKYVKV